MNYRHAYHAGNYADVFKHALVLALIRAFQRKEAPFLFLDSHAGRGRYDLSAAGEGDRRPREPEWPSGIGKLWDRADGPPAVLEYLALVRNFDRSQGNLENRPRFYPGSPKLASLALRPQDRLGLWEKHPAECAALRRAFKGERRVSVHEADGYRSLRACLPPAERRSLVLVDPPYEDAGEWQTVAQCIEEGLQRFASGTFAVWYPLTERARTRGLLDRLAGLGARALAVELVIRPQAAKMRGCGLAVLGAPWRFDEAARQIQFYLETVLSEAPGEGSVRWIAPK